MGQQTLGNILTLLLLTLAARYGYAQSGAPDLYVDAEFAMMTYKSKFLASNDTGTALRYGVGNAAGSEGQLRFQILTEVATTPFALVDSSMQVAWQDTSVRYQWHYVYLGLLFSRLELKVTQAGTETYDAAGSGIGALAGAYFPIGRRGNFYLDLNSVSISTMKNSLTTEIAVPARLDIDLGARVDLSRRFLFAFGYRVRNFTVKTDAAYAESVYHTYLGLRYSLSF